MDGDLKKIGKMGNQLLGGRSDWDKQNEHGKRHQETRHYDTVSVC
jgi:hypothetical protein